MSRHLLIVILQGVMIVCLVLAGATLIPSNVPKVSDMGYATFCPFAPWSTITLLFLAGLSWVVRQHVRSLPE